MKVLATLIICALFGGCLSYKLDQRVVGHFEAPTGEAIDIRPDGWITYVTEKKVERVGLVSIGKEEPLTVHVIAPDTSPLVGTKMVFSGDRKEIVVEWESAIVGPPKPITFQKR